MSAVYRVCIEIISGMAGFEPILYDCEEVGKRMKSSKVKHIWMFEISGSNFTVEYYDSRRSGKARVTLNELEIFRGKKQGSEFTLPLTVGRKQALLVIKGSAVDLLINNQYFKHVLARLQQEQPRREDEFEPDFPDEPAESIRPKPKGPQRPAEPQRSKAPAEKPRDPFEGARPEATPPVKDIKTAQQDEATLLSLKPKPKAADPFSSDFEKGVNLYPSDSFESAKPGPSNPTASLLDDIFSAPVPVSQPARQPDDDLLGGTIRPDKSPAAQQPPSGPPTQPVQFAQNQGPQPAQFASNQGPAQFASNQGPAMPQQMPYMGPYMTGQVYMSPQGMMYMPQPGMPMPPSMYMSQPGMMYVAPGTLAMPMQGVIPAVRKDLELSTPPNIAPTQYNNQGDMPDFFTPHLGLIGSNPKVAKRNLQSDEPVILETGNPFTSASHSQDTTFSSDTDLHSVVDLSNLGKNMHSPPLAQRYQDQVRGVQVPGSDPTVPMKDLSKRS